MSSVINPATPSAAIYAQPSSAPADQSTAAAWPKRQLSEKQLRIPFFRAALSTMQAAGECRRSLLPRLLYRSASGRKTRTEIYDSLKSAAEPMLARFDLATGVLGWLDGQGNFRLNNQKGIAKDAGLTTSSFNRLISVLTECGYAQKRTAKISVKDKSLGIYLVRTRVLIRLTGLFFRHLGLSLRYGLARKSARKRRLRLLSQIERQRLQAATDELKRKRATAKRQAEHEARQQVNDEYRDLSAERDRQARALEIKMENPQMTSAQIYALIDSQQT